MFAVLCGRDSRFQSGGVGSCYNAKMKKWFPSIGVEFNPPRKFAAPNPPDFPASPRWPMLGRWLPSSRGRELRPRPPNGTAFLPLKCGRKHIYAAVESAYAIGYALPGRFRSLCVRPAASSSPTRVAKSLAMLGVVPA